ncbi:MAG: signal recognition particle-docking protein FtsY, partial [Betaproteobacteria bacterium]|nr:signal recognition particle-docking protein FtsY [Betaproteobacteria bacterium]
MFSFFRKKSPAPSPEAARPTPAAATPPAASASAAPDAA